MALPAALKERMKEKEQGAEVREGKEDMHYSHKKPKAKKGKAKKDTEIVSGLIGAEGVTKMNDPRKKGAPSLDDENADACGKKMDKKYADASYGKKMDKKGGKSCSCQHKNDALTPQEYLKACDMGIQDRSRIYIRARLDEAERLDKAGTGKKCGASYISKAATCSKGPGGSASKPKKGEVPANATYQQLNYGNNQKIFTAAEQSQKGKRGRKIAENLGALASVASAGYGVNKALKGEYNKGLGYINAGGAGLNLVVASKANRIGAKGIAKGALTRAGISAAGSAAGFGAARLTLRNRRRKLENIYRGGSAKRDSGAWAKGFSKSDAESAMSANSMNLATDIYAREGRKGNAQGQPKNYIQARTFNT